MSYCTSVRHIDTCLPCYLQDHHTRDNELLLGVPVDGNMTERDVMDVLLDEWQSDYTEMNPKAADEITATIEGMIEAASDKLFDADLEVVEDDADEPAYEGPVAWFLVKWSNYSE